MSVNPSSARSKLVLPWLYLCLLMVFSMVFVGGVTRLTESGLSIVEWKLISGILPPLSEAAWEAELEAYRSSPEYQIKNKGMTVPQFKQIFWLEWGHRLLGRATGLVFLIPFAYFALRRQIDRPLFWRCLIAGALVGMQGTVGWFMVQSGLVDDPRVSPVKLSMHLSLAFIVFCYVCWTVWLLRHPAPSSRMAQPEGSDQMFQQPQAAIDMTKNSKKRIAIRLITLVVFIQIILGAWVAGMDAGMVYNTWPLMDGDIAPPNLMTLEPWHRNFIENIPQVQFQHRTMAYMVAGIIVLYVGLSWKRTPKGQRRWLVALSAVIKVQFSLGVLTLLYRVPIGLASAHQMVALILLVLCLYQCFLTRNSASDVFSPTSKGN